jgi:hypothetical protein
LTNVWEKFADKQMSPRHKRETEKEARKQMAKAARPPMVLTGLEKKLAEKSKQLIRYRQWKAEVREGMSRGDYGDEIVELLRMLRRPSTRKDLVPYVLNAKWIMKCSLETRSTLLSYIDNAMVLERERNGYPPFDDPMIGEPPNDFMIIRKHLTGV